MQKMSAQQSVSSCGSARAMKRRFCGGLSLVASLLVAGNPALTAGLNDTGTTTYGNATSNNLTTEPADYPGQDASHGRDASAKSGILTKVGGGSAGFDFTKIDANGNTLPADAVTWSCVRDNITGLVWEMKTNDGSLHDKDWTYTWYNHTGVNDGGSAGTSAGGSCGGTVTDGCDTEKFVAAVNVENLCGVADWRLPSSNDLLSIVDNSLISPAIDTMYFPNTNSAHYWSSTPSATLSNNAWYVNFNYGYVFNDENNCYKWSSLYVRLVRGRQ